VWICFIIIIIIIIIIKASGPDPAGNVPRTLFLVVR
jgi:hypothetical protein